MTLGPFFFRYPLYQRGNPQLRVFLPNFWMKIVRPSIKQKPNIVQFECSMEMTKIDVKNYLEKIYNVPVVDIRTRIALGRFRKEPTKGYVIKDDDQKFAYVTLVSTILLIVADPTETAYASHRIKILFPESFRLNWCFPLLECQFWSLK